MSDAQYFADVDAAYAAFGRAVAPALDVLATTTPLRKAMDDYNAAVKPIGAALATALGQAKDAAGERARLRAAGEPIPPPRPVRRVETVSLPAAAAEPDPDGWD